MKILVAGGAGYVGQRLCPRLLALGHQVMAVDDLRLGNPPPYFPHIKLDLMCLKASDLEGYDQVIFLAGISNDPMADFNPAMNYIQNSAVPAYLADIAKRAKVKRFIYASSASIYGICTGAVTEESTPATSAPYGLSKLSGERAVLQLADTSFEVIALRKGTISGYSPRMRFDLCVNAMYKDASTKGYVRVNSSQTWRPILTMSDAISAYVASVYAPSGVSGVYNIASFNSKMSVVGHIVAQETKAMLVLENKPELRDYAMDCTKASSFLGFKGIGTLTDIVKELKENCGPGLDFNRDEYYNIRMLGKHPCV